MKFMFSYFCWVSWDKMTKPKKLGGLGFRDIQSFNDVLLAKLSWRIIKDPNCLLARVLCGKYCGKATFLESHVPANASHGWRSICIGRDMLSKNIGWAIGNGSSTKIWNDPWLSLSKRLQPLGPAIESSLHCNVVDLFKQDSPEWDEDKLQHLIPHHFKEIMSLKPSLLGAEDKLIWLRHPTGEYSAKSGYFSIQEEANSHQETTNPPNLNWNSAIWTAHTVPKLKISMWKVLQGAIPVGENFGVKTYPS